MNNICPIREAMLSLAALLLCHLVAAALLLVGKPKSIGETRAVSFPGKVVRGIKEFNLGYLEGFQSDSMTHDFVFYLVQKKDEVRCERNSYLTAWILSLTASRSSES